MKKIVLILTLFVLVISCLAQTVPPISGPPSQHNAGGKPGLIINMFIENQTFLPGGENRFDMTYKLKSGGIITIPIWKNLSFVLGGRTSVYTVNKYSFASRSWAQFEFHLANGLFWTKNLNGGTLTIGPSIAKLSYVLSGVPYSPDDNKKFSDFTKSVRDTVKGIPGNYYSAPYLFVSYKKRQMRDFYKWKNLPTALEIELNMLIPGNWPDQISSWQPQGNLMHLGRVKFIYDIGRFGFKADIQVPTVMLDKVEYHKPMFSQTTGKVELSYIIQMTNGKIRPTIGYERDWHASNYPGLLKSGMNGAWGAGYFGIRFELGSMKMRKTSH